jgi:hypothetical protein
MAAAAKKAAPKSKAAAVKAKGDKPSESEGEGRAGGRRDDE